ncbi:PKD domain-containing protein [Streptomyces sp. NPDC057686]|uniref:PKD domain-containing protein n=1 Tax=Streptomyces sp. NPDC057686 TaxID=3346212 RepID=UPI0036CD0B42
MAWGDGTTDAITMNGGEVRGFNKHTYPRPGDYTVTVTATDTVNKVQAVNQLAFSTAGSFFVPHTPTRLLDTRSGVGAAKAKVGAYSSVWVKIAGRGKVPTGVAAVVLNVTVTNTTAGGHVSAYPAGKQRPESYTSLNPVRFVDTREGLGAARGQVPGQGTFGVRSPA